MDRRLGDLGLALTVTSSMRSKNALLRTLAIVLNSQKAVRWYCPNYLQSAKLNLCVRPSVKSRFFMGAVRALYLRL